MHLQSCRQRLAQNAVFASYTYCRALLSIFPLVESTAKNSCNGFQVAYSMLHSGRGEGYTFGCSGNGNLQKWCVNRSQLLCLHTRFTSSISVQANIFYDHLPVTLAKRASSAIFNCEAYGYPKPSIIWYSSGRDLRNTKKYRQLANGSLEILNVRVEDAGEYECTASNALGRKTVVRKLQVQSKYFALAVSVISQNERYVKMHTCY